MRRFIYLAIILFLTASGLEGQRARPRATPTKPSTPAPSAPEKKFKAIWEPVNYKDDLDLTDALFVNENEGWVTGAAGTILHTKDGGETWTPQLGGDPQSKDKEVKSLRFVDEKHGWAVQGKKLLRTTDGESWEEIGSIGEHFGYYEDYAFTSPTNGVQIVKEGSSLYQTSDAGHTWKQVLPGCSAKTEIDGLAQTVPCRLKSLHFPSVNVGFAVGAGPHETLFVVRTDDGGTTWNYVAVTPNTTEHDEWYFRQDVFFIDENTGFIHLDKGGKMLMATDGGKAWRGLAGGAVNGQAQIKFADPGVGWVYGGKMFGFTTSGGKQWSTREFRFPAPVNAFSLPRRNRGYVVGRHGMVYRYRIVPAEYSVNGMIDAPMMPSVETKLTKSLLQLRADVKDLEAVVQKTRSAVENGADVAGMPETVQAGFDSGWTSRGILASPKSWAETCCGSALGRVDSTLLLLAAEIPEYLVQYRNLNLVLVGLRLATELPAKLAGLEAAVGEFRLAEDAATAMSALERIKGAHQDFAAAISKGGLAAPDNFPASGLVAAAEPNLVAFQLLSDRSIALNRTSGTE